MMSCDPNWSIFRTWKNSLILIGSNIGTIKTSETFLFSFSPPIITGTMSDSATTVDPSPAPTAPTGPRPKVTNRGRTAFAIASSNSESTEVPEFEPFIAPGPRGFPPMTGEISKT